MDPPLLCLYSSSCVFYSAESTINCHMSISNWFTCFYTIYIFPLHVRSKDGSLRACIRLQWSKVSILFLCNCCNLYNPNNNFLKTFIFLQTPFCQLFSLNRHVALPSTLSQHHHIPSSINTPTQGFPHLVIANSLPLKVLLLIYFLLSCPSSMITPPSHRFSFFNGFSDGTRYWWYQTSG